MTNREYTIWGLGFVVSLFSWIILFFIDRFACVCGLGGAFVSVLGIALFEKCSDTFKYRAIYIAGALTAGLSMLLCGTNFFLSFFYGFMLAITPVFIIMIYQDLSVRRK